MRAKLEGVQTGGTPVERAIAAWLLDHISELPFETAASMAARIRVSEVSIGRFARSIGYRNLKEMKEAMKAEGNLQALQAVSDSPWLAGAALAGRIAERDTAAEAAKLSLERELRAVMRNHETAASPEFQRCAERLATAPRVLVTGFQTERGLASYLAHNLGYLRADVQEIRLDSGHFAEIFLDAPPGSALVLIETRRYSRLARQIAERAQAAGLGVSILTDPYCGWAREFADEVFSVDTDLNHFWDSTGQIAGLINLLVNRVFERLGPGIEARLNTISENYGAFIGHQR